MVKTPKYIQYLFILFLNLSAHTSVFNIFSKDIITQYPEINPFYDNNENINALTHCLISEEKNWNEKIDPWLNKRITYPDYKRPYDEKYWKKIHIKDYLKKNCTDLITTAIKLWKIDGAMNLLVAYEIHRFHAGFDYNFTDITNLETFKLAYKKGYIKDKPAEEKFKILFTKTVQFFCSCYTFGQFIIDPRGIKVPIPYSLDFKDLFKDNQNDLQYKYKNGNLTIQNSSIEYIFKHHNDSLKPISSKKISSPLKKTNWSRSGNIGTNLSAKMNGVEKMTYYGFKIYPASIGCYRDIILNYSHELFYGFATMWEIWDLPQKFLSPSLYFFYGYLPQHTENKNFSLKEFFLLHEMIYYKYYISWLKLQLLRLLPISRINRITSKKPYLKHITDTFVVGATYQISTFNIIIRTFFHFLSIDFLVKNKGRYLKTNLCLIFLNGMVYLLSTQHTYKNLYIWCGLE